MLKIIWSHGALKDIERLYNFLEPINPRAANRAIKTIRAGVKPLKTMPGIGRKLPGQDPDFREKLVNFGASVYVVRYRIGARTITILAIRHGRESEDLNDRSR